VDLDIHEAYDSHANGYITKPGSIDLLTAMVETIERFWVAIVRLPKVARGATAAKRRSQLSPSGRLVNGNLET
jgi:hypothetical protein